MPRTNDFGGTNLDQAHAYNRHLILEAIRVHGVLSRAELTRLTGLAPQTISNITGTLVNADLIVTRKRSGGGRGQPPTDLSLNPKGGYAFGASIDKQCLFVVLMNMVGDCLGKVSIAVENATADRVLFDLESAVKSLRRTFLQAGDRVLGTGIAMTGLTTHGSFIGLAPDATTSRWQGSSLEGELRARLGMPIFTDNDARAAAAGEALYGQGRRFRDFVYIYFGVGVGGGIINAGQPFRGNSGRAGEFGHMIVDPGGRACPCGNRGCLEQYASMTSALGSIDALSAADGHKALAHAIEASDPRLEAWVKSAARHLQTAVVNLENIFDPEGVLLGGIIPEVLLDAIYDRILPLPRSVASSRSTESRRLIRSSLGPAIPAMGAASLALFNATSADPSLLFKKNTIPRALVEAT